MIWIYFLLLIPLITAMRWYDDRDQFYGRRGNKPILRMSANVDDSEFDSGKRSIEAKSGTDWNRIVKKLYNERFKSDPMRSLRIIDGFEENGTPVLRMPVVNDDANSSPSTRSKHALRKGEIRRTKPDSKNEVPTKSNFQGFFNWLFSNDTSKSTRMSENQDYPEAGTLNVDFQNLIPLTREDGKVVYIHQENAGWKEKLWWFFFGSSYPSQIFGRASDLYSGVMNPGKRALRKDNKNSRRFRFKSPRETYILI